MDARRLAALAEPNRLRIVELLDAAPRPVGEIAARLDLRQPQVTTHLQTLERAGLVTRHPLGQRRIYALRREGLRELRDWLGAMADERPSEDVLTAYRRAVAAEEARMASGAPAERTLEVAREVPAPPGEVWRAWTSADLVRRWWSPDHFEVADAVVEPVPGGRLEIVMAEGDGNHHRATGRFLALDEPSSLSFALAPLGPDGAPLFSAVHHVAFTRAGAGTAVAMTIHVSDVAPAAAPALAGVTIGWEQMLAKLAVLLAA
jgi:uncharacterized protein YndB with AHSA1/START domain/DNA-binding transcriptional ArsR family regulator